MPVSQPRVALGMPLYDAGVHLTEALDSLLAQTFGDFRLVVVDDGSADGSDAIVREYASRDPRVSYERNATRLGLVGNWRRAFERALAAAPGAELFAWVGDHDRWEPGWLERLVVVLDAEPAALLAYPRADALDAEGAVLPRRNPVFSTAGEDDPAARVLATARTVMAGWTVYGLFRADALRRCGVFRAVVFPDRLLLSEVALYGEVHQVDAVLWHRRYLQPPLGRAPYARQRRTLFADPPLHTYAPWWLQHAAVLAWGLAVRGRGRPGIGRGGGAALAGRHLARSWLLSVNDRRVVKRWRRRVERWRALGPRAAARSVGAAAARRLARR